MTAPPPPPDHSARLIDLFSTHGEAGTLTFLNARYPLARAWAYAAHQGRVGVYIVGPDDHRAFVQTIAQVKQLAERTHRLDFIWTLGDLERVTGVTGHPAVRDALAKAAADAYSTTAQDVSVFLYGKRGDGTVYSSWWWVDVPDFFVLDGVAVTRVQEQQQLTLLVRGDGYTDFLRRLNAAGAAK